MGENNLWEYHHSTIISNCLSQFSPPPLPLLCHQFIQCTCQSHPPHQVNQTHLSAQSLTCLPSCTPSVFKAQSLTRSLPDSSPRCAKLSQHLPSNWFPVPVRLGSSALREKTATAFCPRPPPPVSRLPCSRRQLPTVLCVSFINWNPFSGH